MNFELEHISSEGRKKKKKKSQSSQAYMCGSENHHIQTFGLSCEFIRLIGTEGSRVGLLSRPQDLAVDSKGNLYITDVGNNNY